MYNLINNYATTCIIYTKWPQCILTIIEMHCTDIDHDLHIVVKLYILAIHSNARRRLTTHAVFQLRTCAYPKTSIIGGYKH